MGKVACDDGKTKHGEDAETNFVREVFVQSLVELGMTLARAASPSGPFFRRVHQFEATAEEWAAVHAMLVTKSQNMPNVNRIPCIMAANRIVMITDAPDDVKRVAMMFVYKLLNDTHAPKIPPDADL